MEPAMNHSIYTADRATHLKVVVAVLLASIAIVATTLGSRLAQPDVTWRATAVQTIYKPCPGNTLTETAGIERQPI
jgi:hypothetical protein